MGRPTFSRATALESSQWLSTDELVDLQMTKLRRLASHAKQNCPYYRQSSLPPPQELSSPDDVRAIPLLSRETLRNYAKELRWAEMPGRIITDRTHGTSGEPFVFYCDRDRQAWDKANRIRGHRWHGFEPGDRELHLWPVDPPHGLAAHAKELLRRIRDRLLSEHQIDSLTVFRSDVNQAMSGWHQFDPMRVTAYPSCLTRLLRDTRGSIDQKLGSSLRSVFLTGEVAFPWQKRIISESLGVPIVQCYGLQEAGAVAFECEHGNWHTSAESILVEIVRNGVPAQSGELGEVVVTALESRAMPVIRYCTGDIVRAEQLSCRCGRGLPVIPRILGRACDFLEAADGNWIAPVEVVASLADVLEDGSWQITQDNRGHLLLDVLEGRQRRDNWREQSSRSLLRILGDSVVLAIRTVLDLRLSNFGKCRYVQSQRTGVGLAIPRNQSVVEACLTGRIHHTRHSIPRSR